MKIKKILTIDDLVNFCKTSNFTTFNSKEFNYNIYVQVPSEYSCSEISDEHTLFGKVKAFHTGKNYNGSNITYEAMERTLPKLKYKPVLANFCEIDGVRDFTSHDFIVKEDNDIEYIERQIGCFTADEPIVEYDQEKDKYYVYANVAIPREYTDAAEIIERKNGTAVSVEIAVYAMKYDKSAEELILEDIEITGLTLLGKDPNTGKDVEGAMEGARLAIEDFSEKNNRVCFDSNNKLIQALNQLNSTISNFSINKKGGETVSEVKEKEENKVVNQITYSINDFVFSISLDEIQATIHTLVNNTYVSDGTYYSTIVYPEYVVMVDTWTDKAYRQGYTINEGKYVLNGERVAVESHWLTSEESKKLDEMRENYVAFSEKITKYEEEPAKMEILNSKDYESVYSSTEFEELKNNHFDMSIDEVKSKADDILLSFAKQGRIAFNKQEEKPQSIFYSMRFGTKENVDSRYGNLFSKQSN